MSYQVETPFMLWLDRWLIPIIIAIIIIAHLLSTLPEIGTALTCTQGEGVNTIVCTEGTP